jgi:hypothetical protein
MPLNGARAQKRPFIGGEEKKIEPAAPRYSALYEIDSSRVLVTAKWQRREKPSA